MARFLAPLLLVLAVLIGGAVAFSALRSGDEGNASGDQAANEPKANQPKDQAANEPKANQPKLSGEAENVRQAVLDYFTAFAEKDAERACGLLTKSAQRKTVRFAGAKSGNCANVLERKLAPTPDQELEGFRQGQVTRVKVAQDSATAGFAFGETQGTFALQKVDGEWKITPAKAPVIPDPAPSG